MEPDLGPHTLFRYPQVSSTFPSNMDVATMLSELAVRIPDGAAILSPQGAMGEASRGGPPADSRLL
jgi:hypothetical protein